MNALCLSDINVPKHGFNLFDKTFDKILTNTLHNVIGHKSVIDFGDFTFGIKDIRVR